MRVLAFIVIASLQPSLTVAQPLPQPFPPGPGGNCPHGFSRSGSFCVPRAGAQDAIPLPPNSTCPHGWTQSDDHALAPDIPPSALQTNSMITATKLRIFEMTFNASGSGSAGKANPNAAQTANTTNIPATA